jgi:ribose-phosphate pyrophosphokinase
MLLYALQRQDAAFALALADALDISLSPHEERCFEDGESQLRPLADPRGADAYVLTSLYGEPLDSPRDKLTRLLFFIAALKDHGARRVTAVVPYLAFARKDRRTKAFDPLTLRYVAQLLEAVGLDQLITVETHNLAALENAFRCPTRHVPLHEVFAAEAEALAGAGPLCIASPDPGGLKRAQAWQEDLAARLGRPVGLAMVDKRRSEGVVSGGELVAGDVRQREVLLVDDLIATGSTVQRAAAALCVAGARRVRVCAAHGLFVRPAAARLNDPAIAELLVTDTVPAFRLAADDALRSRLRTVSCIPALALAMRASSASVTR